MLQGSYTESPFGRPLHALLVLENHMPAQARTAAGIVSIPDASSNVSPQRLRDGAGPTWGRLLQPFSALGMMLLQSVRKGPRLKN
jgi:hypothetical protein